MKKALKIIGIALAILLALALLYVAYVFIDYHRIGDQPLEVNASATAAAPAPGVEYKVVSFNIGFGAYESDYGFFMDGGTQSWAWSKERLNANLEKIAELLRAQDAPLVVLQEVDIGSTRTYHVDERRYFTEAFPNYTYTFAQNYDSPFLFYPFTQPHGASKSGLMTFSAFPIRSGERVELPVESGVTKLLDLDRCYAKNRIATANGKELVLYNLHLSAYTSDGAIATEQLKLLLADMEEEYQKGNYCIAGGDFNKDLLGNSSVYFGAADREYTWGQPIPAGTFDGFHTRVVAPLNEQNPVPSCRNADSAYHEGQYVLTIDGFLITENVKAVSSGVIDTQFAYSDHNPVEMRFELLP